MTVGESEAERWRLLNPAAALPGGSWNAVGIRRPGAM